MVQARRSVPVANTTGGASQAAGSTGGGPLWEAGAGRLGRFVDSELQREGKG